MLSEVRALRNTADSLRKVDLTEALLVYKKMLALAKAKADVRGQIEAYRSLVFVNAALLQQVDSALKYSDEAVVFGNNLGDANTLCDIYGNRAVVFQVAGMIDSATVANKLALGYMDSDHAPDSFKNWPLYLNLANFYSNQLESHKIAVEYTNRYLNEYALVVKDESSIESSYNNLALFYLRMSDSINSQKYLYKAKAMHALIPGERNDKYAKVCFNLFLFHNEITKNIDSAKYYLDESINNRQLGNRSNEASGIIGLAVIANKRKDKKLAQEIVLKYHPMNFLSENYIGKNTLWVMFSQYYKLYELLDDKDKAMEYLKISNQMGEEVWHQTQDEEMEKFEIERRKVMQENKILANELKIKKKNNAILLLVIVSIIIAIVALFVYLVFKRRNELLRIEKEYEKKTALLKGQLEERNRISRELHDDLGASLTSIALSGKVLKQNNPEIKDDLNLIANTANDVVDALNEIVWSLNSRNDSLIGLAAYIRKYATNYLNKMEINLEVIENIPDADLPVSSEVRRAIFLTSKEAINNLVKHSRAQNAWINFDFHPHQLKLNLTIMDDGGGDSTYGIGGGNGLLNMKKNMELVGGSCSIARDNGFTVMISIGLESTPDV